MTRRVALLFAAMCVIWGIPYFLIRVSVAEISPVVLVFGRTAIGALILMPVVLVRGGLKGIGRRWLPLLAFALVEMGGPWFFLSSAEQRISSSLAGLFISSTPLIGVVVASLFGNRERMGPIGFLGLALGILGVAAIVGLDFNVADSAALAEMAAVAVGYALGPAVVRRYLSDLPAVTVSAVSLAACALVYAPLAATHLPRVVPGVPVFASVAALGVVCTATAFLLFFLLIQRIGPVRATVITYINPAVASLVGVLVLHESFTAGMGIGFILVLAGSFLATRRRGATGQARPKEAGHA